MNTFREPASASFFVAGIYLAVIAVLIIGGVVAWQIWIEPDISEPDTIYAGPNDQTVVVLRNGQAITTEADTTSVTGDCPPGK